jgi:hypothetical protein
MASDPVTTDPKGEVRGPAASPQISGPHKTPVLAASNPVYGDEVALDPWFVTGLTEGEGCFCVSFALRSKLRTGVEARPSFSLSLNERDRRLLEDLQTFFGCGWIRRSEADRTYKYEVRSVPELCARIVPHFERFRIRGSKAWSFNGFARVCRMIEQGDHLRRDGIREIIHIAYETSLGRRRLPRADLLRAVAR